METKAKVIIVGDDKQVSPMAVGVDIDKVERFHSIVVLIVISRNS